MSMVDLIIGIISFALTVMVFSYIIGDNFFFRLAIYLLVGVSAGYVAALLLTSVIIPKLIQPLLNGAMEVRFLALIPLVLSAMLLAMLIPRFVHIGSVPLAYLVGVVAALTIGGVTMGTIIPQMVATMNRFNPAALLDGEGQTWLKIVDAVLVLIGTITSLLYFYFGAHKKPKGENKKPQLIEGLGKIGQVFIGITLGALFAGIYSAALMALVSRVAEIWAFFGSFFRL